MIFRSSRFPCMYATSNACKAYAPISKPIDTLPGVTRLGMISRPPSRSIRTSRNFVKSLDSSNSSNGVEILIDTSHVRCFGSMRGGGGESIRSAKSASRALAIRSIVNICIWADCSALLIVLSEHFALAANLFKVHSFAFRILLMASPLALTEVLISIRLPLSCRNLPLRWNPRCRKHFLLFWRRSFKPEAKCAQQEARFVA